MPLIMYYPWVLHTLCGLERDVEAIWTPLNPSELHLCQIVHVPDLHAPTWHFPLPSIPDLFSRPTRQRFEEAKAEWGDGKLPVGSHVGAASHAS